MHWRELADHCEAVVDELIASGVTDEALAGGITALATDKPLPDDLAGLEASMLHLAWYLFAFCATEDDAFRPAALVGLASARAGVHGALAEVFDLARSALEAAYAARAEWPAEKRLAFYFERGNQRVLAAGQHLGALIDFTSALEAAPNDLHALHNRGATYKILQSWEEAHADFTAALALDEGFTLARLKRGGVLYTVGEDEDAIADLSRAARELPEGPDLDDARRMLADLGVS